jgi:hypothetical protein
MTYGLYLGREEPMPWKERSSKENGRQNAGPIYVSSKWGATGIEDCDVEKDPTTRLKPTHIHPHQ